MTKGCDRHLQSMLPLDCRHLSYIATSAQIVPLAQPVRDGSSTSRRGRTSPLGSHLHAPHRAYFRMPARAVEIVLNDLLGGVPRQRPVASLMRPRAIMSRMNMAATELPIPAWPWPLPTPQVGKHGHYTLRNRRAPTKSGHEAPTLIGRSRYF